MWRRTDFTTDGIPKSFIDVRLPKLRAEKRRLCPATGVTLPQKPLFSALALPPKPLRRFEVGKDKSVFSRARTGLMKATLVTAIGVCFAAFADVAHAGLLGTAAPNPAAATQASTDPTASVPAAPVKAPTVAVPVAVSVPASPSAAVVPAATTPAVPEAATTPVAAGVSSVQAAPSSIETAVKTTTQAATSAVANVSRATTSELAQTTATLAAATTTLTQATTNLTQTTATLARTTTKVMRAATAFNRVSRQASTPGPPSSPAATTNRPSSPTEFHVAGSATAAVPGMADAVSVPLEPSARPALSAVSKRTVVKAAIFSGAGSSLRGAVDRTRQATSSTGRRAPLPPPLPVPAPGFGLLGGTSNAGGGLLLFGLVLLGFLLVIPNAVRWLRPALALGLSPAYVAIGDRPG